MQLDTTCCVVGGGPAGMMTGVLLARAGVDVVVLEKHQDFLRDFRGNTIHPSTQELLHELGWLAEFHQLDHNRMDAVTVAIGNEAVTLADFRKLPVPAPYIVFMPQWDFLNFLAAKGKQYPGFRLMQKTEMTELITKNGRAIGVRARREDSDVDIRADVVIGADGRHSTIRDEAWLKPHAKSPPMDVLWFQLPRTPQDDVPFFRTGNGALVCIDRGEYWQIAYTIPPGSYGQMKRAGIAELRRRIAALAPDLAERTEALRDWDAVSHLSVRVDRLAEWYRPGLLCIGDAAHAMSPAGGVGINLAIQDAVATTNILSPKLLRREVTTDDLARVQRRRQLPAAITQTFQVALLRDLYPKDLDDNAAAHPPAIFRLFHALPPLRHLMGRFIGLGIRREHIARLPTHVTQPGPAPRDMTSGGADH